MEEANIMPITQDRMLKLIYAGRAWKQAYEAAEQQIRHLSIEINDGRLDAFIGILNMNGVFHQNQPRVSITMPLEIEGERMNPSRQHFNNKERDRQASRRRKRGVRAQARPPASDQFIPAPADFVLSTDELRALTPQEELEAKRSMNKALKEGQAPPQAQPEVHSLAEITPRAVTDEDIEDGLF